MTQLSYTERSLKFSGIYFIKKWTFPRILNCTYGRLLLIAVIIIAINTAINKPTHIPIYFAVATVIATSLNRAIINKSGQRINQQLDLLLNCMDIELQHEVNKSDMYLNVFCWINWIVVFPSLFTYSFVTGNHNFLRLMTGLDTIALIPEVAQFLEVLFILICFRFVAAHDSFVIYYVITQYTLYSHAKQLINDIKHINNRIKQTGPDLASLAQSYVIHLDIKRTINDTLGFTPLSTFALMYIIAVAGVSHVIVNQNQFNLTFLIIVFVPLATVRFVQLMAMVIFCDRATRALILARNQMSRMLTLPTVASPISKKFLNNLLLIEEVVPATAWSMFEINNCTLLQFANCTVPMAVMVITSHIQFAERT